MTTAPARLDPPLPSSECRRCGTCCRKGGPAFHRADRHLVESGRIPASLLYAIRAGEPVRDNVTERIVVAESDIVKLRGTGDTPVCVRYDPDAGCAIYPDRPLECRILDCRNTGPIVRFYRRDRLTRLDLFGSVPGLRDLIREHQALCDYDRVRRAAADLDGSDIGEPERENALFRLSEMLQFDRMVRTEPVRTGRVPADWTDLLFGRPLSRTLSGFGLRVSAEGDRFRIRKNPAVLAFRADPVSPKTPPSRGGPPCSTSTSC
jgi:hypothetical protein